jgi:hypothetical protein
LVVVWVAVGMAEVDLVATVMVVEAHRLDPLDQQVACTSIM